MGATWLIRLNDPCSAAMQAVYTTTAATSQDTIEHQTTSFQFPYLMHTQSP